MAEFDISTQLYGTITGSFYLSYALLQIPFGLALDSYRLNYVMFATTCCYACGLLVTATAGAWELIALGRFLIGLGAIGGFLGTVKIITIMFAPKQHPIMIAITFSLGFIGAIISGKPTALLITQLGWRTFHYWLIVPCLLLGLIFLTCLTTNNYTNNNAQNNSWKQLKLLLSTPKLLHISLFGGMTIGTLEGLSDGWGITLLHAKGMSLTDAGLINSLIFVGLGIGSPLLTYISDKFNCLKLTLTVSSFAMALISFCYIHFNFDFNWYLILAFILGIGAGNQVLIFVTNNSLVSPNLVGMSAAITNSVVMSFGILFHQIIGLVTDYSRLYFTPEHQLYTVNNFKHGLFIIPLFCGIGSIGFYQLLYRKQGNSK